MMRPVLWLALALLPSAAIAGQPKQVDVFKDLLPPGHVIVDTPSAPAPEILREATLAIVASTNFENITTMWVDYYERGGAQAQAQNLAMLGSVMGAAGMTDSAKGVQQGLQTRDRDVGVTRLTSDPRNVSDRIVAALSPYFGSVVAAEDLASAFEQGADYAAVIDYYGTMYPPMINTRYRANGGVYVFDKSVQRVLLAEGKVELDREGDGILTTPSNIVKGTAMTYEKAIKGTTDQIVSGIRTRLGPPPPPKPVPVAAPTPETSSMAQCIDLCKANTSRTSEQCFDACNR